MATLARVVLKRIEVFVPPSGTPWSRGLWGEFLPDRRQRSESRLPDRRSSPLEP